MDAISLHHGYEECLEWKSQMNVGHLFCISSFKDFSVDFCPMPGNMQTELQNIHSNVLLISSSVCMHAQSFLSCLTLCDPMACSPPGSSVLSSQEYWNGWPCLPQRDLPNPRIEPVSPALQACSLPTEPPGKPYWQQSGRLNTDYSILGTKEALLQLASSFYVFLVLISLCTYLHALVTVSYSSCLNFLKTIQVGYIGLYYSK